VDVTKLRSPVLYRRSF